MPRSNMDNRMRERPCELGFVLRSQNETGRNEDVGARQPLRFQRRTVELGRDCKRVRKWRLARQLGDQPRADLLNIPENRIVLDDLRLAASFAGELSAEGGLSFDAVKVHPATKLVLRIGPNGCQ